MWGRGADHINPSLSPQAHEQGGDSQYSRAGEDGCLSLSRKSKFTLPLPFCSIWAFNGLGDAHAHWGGLFALSSALIQILIFQKHPHRHTQKSYFTIYLGNPWPTQIDIKLTTTEEKVFRCFKV